MKALIDIDRELAGGHITAARHARLKALMREQITELALNILIGFGVIAFTIGFAALASSAGGLVVEGAAIGIAGLAIVLMAGPKARFFGQLLLVVGLILFGGAMITLDEFAARSIFGVSALLFGAALFIGSRLLVALSVLTLSGALGASTAYHHAEYTLVVDQPAVTIGAFMLLAVVGVVAANVLPRFEGVLIVGARTAALLVNFAFLVGSLWGDRVGTVQVTPGAFTVGWALVLLAVAVWAWHADRRWPLVTATVFGGIHFYTQLFERFGGHAGTVLVAGLVTIAVGFGLKLLANRAASSGSPGAVPNGA